MIVATYNTSDDHGGAAKAAFRLNSALRKAGVEAFFLCRHKQTRDEYCSRVVERRSELSPRLTRLESFWTQTASPFLIAESRTGLSSTIFTVDPFGLDVTEAPIAAIARAHHLHWCRGFISPAAIRFLRATGRPIFVTLHDQWWMSGGCHYTAGCDRFETDCADCPQLLSDPAGIAPLALQEKVGVFNDGETTVIAPSRWIADCARRSAVFHNADIHVVRNSIDIATFAPLSPDARAAARAELGLEEDDVAILFGAQTLTDRRKGFAELVEALRLVRERSKRRLCLVSFGRPARRALNIVGVPTVELGEISDDARLARVYAATDLFVIPSLEDNYPNTIVESLACGTPVVGFAAGGIVDLVDGETTGLLAGVGDVAQLAGAILAGIEKFSGNEAARSACRLAVAQSHDPQTIAAKMIDLYAAKSPGFADPITEEESAIIKAAVDRNRSGRSVFARLDISPAIFSSEVAMKILMPLSGVHRASRERADAVSRAADLTVAIATPQAIGRGKDALRHLGKGWAEPFLAGVWSAEASAHLHFFVGAEQTVNRLDLQLAASNDLPIVVTAHVNGGECARWMLADKQPHDFTVSFAPVTGPAYFNLSLAITTQDETSQADQKSAPKVFLSALSVRHDERPARAETPFDRLIDGLRSIAGRARAAASR